MKKIILALTLALSATAAQAETTEEVVQRAIEAQQARIAYAKSVTFDTYDQNRYHQCKSYIVHTQYFLKKKFDITKAQALKAAGRADLGYVMRNLLKKRIAKMYDNKDYGTLDELTRECIIAHL